MTKKDIDIELDEDYEKDNLLTLSDGEQEELSEFDKNIKKALEYNPKD